MTSGAPARIADGPLFGRALIPFDPRSASIEELDVLIVGSGIAGLTVATSLARGKRVAVMTKGRLGVGSTLFAQGGVAASVAPDDTPELHLDDTLTAAAGLADEIAVRVLVEEAPDAVAYLEAQGVRLDLEGLSLAVTREGGHSRRRVVHAGGDATGAEIVRALLAAASDAGVRMVEDGFLVEILTDGDGAVAGALVLVDGELTAVRCPVVVLASGGFGQLYSETTAPRPCTGDGAAAALRAGAELCDVEFVQFHPTALFVDDDPRPLLSEAMRGEGARLVDAQGAPVMEGVHPLGDLAPRDVVARAMTRRMLAEGIDHLYLDATALGAEHLEHRFPTILASCRAHGIDPLARPIPVAPACHYTMGGVRVDLDGRTRVRGLYAVGEVASSGVHGANRLASNSLLEGAVFGRRVARSIDATRRIAAPPQPFAAPEVPLHVPEAARPWLRREMVQRAGVLRNEEGLEGLLASIVQRLPALCAPAGVPEFETANLFAVAAALAVSARRRHESRGAQFRTDFPSTEDAWRCRQIVRRVDDGGLSVLDAPLHTPDNG